MANNLPLANPLVRLLDKVFVTGSDFSDVTLVVGTGTLETAHFTTEGRADSKRRVTIHVAV